MSGDLKKLNVPDEFHKILKDFILGIVTTFPECEEKINEWWKIEDYSHVIDIEERSKIILNERNNKIETLFKYCCKVYPDRFFDILYQNNDIFKLDSEVNTFFLPNINFKYLWNCEITNKSRETIWKYLQLILISIVGTVSDKEDLTDSSKLFEMINNDEFKEKMEITLENMKSLFDDVKKNEPETSFDQNNENQQEQEQEQGQGQGQGQGPFDNFSGILDAKLGQLAKEIAEETVHDLNMNEATNVQDLFQNLLKNPTKLMSLVKNVGSKLDTRLKSGEIKETELFAEATEMMNKMKNMPGMDNMQNLFSKMGFPNMGGAGKMDLNGMEAQLKRNMKTVEMKERMKSNIGKKNQEQQLQPELKQPTVTDDELIALFEKDEISNKKKNKEKSKVKSKK
jgi:hypothetical protein